jgi:hypothetical protein
MRFKVSKVILVGTLSLLVLSAQRSDAKCDPAGADAADVAAARAAVALNCNCAGAANHGAYVSCAAGQAKATLVNQSCKGAVVKCAAKSTCGKPNFVTCCRTKASGATKCSTKSSASKCVPPKGGSACVGNFASCCDACTPVGCVPSPSGAFLDSSSD